MSAPVEFHFGHYLIGVVVGLVIARLSRWLKGESDV